MRILNNKKKINITPYSPSKKISTKPRNTANLFKDVLANSGSQIETQPDLGYTPIEYTPKPEERKAVAL